MTTHHSGSLSSTGRISRRQFLAGASAGAASLALAAACGGGKGAEKTATPAVTGTATAAASELRYLSLENLAARIAARQVSPVEVTQAALDRIEQLQPKLNAFITITGEQALAQARAAEAEIAAGTYRGKLHGIPIAHKDVFDTAGIRTTYGSAVFADRVADADAAVVAKLAEGGAVIVGKLNMWEFADSLSAINPRWGTVRNPWDVDRITGGTSAGSGAAVAAGMAYGTTGSDVGGSIRQPASFCGVVGLMPTYGRVSMYNTFRSTPTLDHPGPLTRTVRDAAIMLRAVAGYDPRDSTTSDVPVPEYLMGIDGGPGGLRIGVPTNYFWDRLDPEVESLTRKAVSDLERAGAEVLEVTYPKAEAYYNALRIVFAVETRIAHAATFPSQRDKYGTPIAVLLDGISDDPAEQQEALRGPLVVIAAARAGEADDLLQGVDVLVMPTNRQPPQSIREAEAIYERGDLVEMEERADGLNTGVFDASGQTSISVPCGLTAAGLPVGLMFVARRWDEATLLRAARAYELVRGPFPNPPV